LAGNTTPPLPPAPHPVVEQQARVVVQTGDDRLCLQTWDHGVQLWTQDGAKPSQQLDLKRRCRLVALPKGCLVSTGEAAYLLTESRSQPLAVEDEAPAMGRWRGGALVAHGGHLDAYDANGQRSERRAIAAGAAAVGQVGAAFVVGYRDGKIELLADHGDGPAPAVAFERTPVSPSTELLAGPMNTLIVGYLSGDVGIWSLTDGSRLAHARLHGPIAHLLLEDDKLYAASELGDHLVWDLGQLQRDYCELMAEVWRRVPVVWTEGHAVVRPPPETHRCRPDPR